MKKSNEFLKKFFYDFLRMERRNLDEISLNNLKQKMEFEKVPKN